jgi:hypothetical protein
MRWAEHVTHTRDIRNVKKLWSENLKCRDLLEDVGLYWRMLKWILKNWGNMM